MKSFRASTGLPPQPYAEEWRRTCPDYLVYHPAPDGNRRWDDGDFLALNEETIVVPFANGELIATWTAHSTGRVRFTRVVVAHSMDGGRTWSKPVVVAGSKESPAAWQVPVATPSGRLYLFYCQYDQIQHGRPCNLDCRVSTDHGRIWSDPVRLPFKRRSIDHPDASHPVAWIGWRQVEWDAKGRALFPFTRFAYDRSAGPLKEQWCQCECMRFENIAQDPSPCDLQISWLPEAEDGAITVPSNNSDACWANEPNVIPLIEGRLMMTLRTRTGRIYYTLSEDDGVTFATPQVMRYCDDGLEILQPSDNAPIYHLSDGRYILLYHNHEGNCYGADDVHDRRNRRPAQLSIGEYRPDARQPIWWSAPKLFADIDDVPMEVGLHLPRSECLDYCGWTEVNGERVIWYPDRKHFVVGKRVTNEFLEGMRTPVKD